MKVKDLLAMDIEVDVYDDVCEELAICFCGPVELTDEGRAHFEVALNLDIEVDYSGDITTALCHVDDEFFPDNVQFKLDKAMEFFYAAAGYCADADYRKWFKEEE